MPIYEYHCENCGKTFDALRSMKDADAPIECKNCQSSDTHRKLSKCYSHSDSGSSNGGGCAGCSSGSCSTCHH